MSKLNREELLKIAELSALKLNEEEIAAFMDELQKVIDYTDELSQVTLGNERKPARNRNIFRTDATQRIDADQLLAQSPEEKDHYFVVPKVIDS